METFFHGRIIKHDIRFISVGDYMLRFIRYGDDLIAGCDQIIFKSLSHQALTVLNIQNAAAVIGNPLFLSFISSLIIFNKLLFFTFFIKR